MVANYCGAIYESSSHSKNFVNESEINFDKISQEVGTTIQLVTDLDLFSDEI